MPSAGTRAIAVLIIATAACGRLHATRAPTAPPPPATAEEPEMPAMAFAPPSSVPPQPSELSWSSADGPGDYQSLVAKAEAGEAVDFYRLRMAYLSSPAYRGDGGDGGDGGIGVLRRQLFQAMRAGTHRRVFELAQQVIDRHYIDLEAHKARRQSCPLIGRADCEKFKNIEVGLLRSLVQGRDGQSCPTAWEVVTIDEEYFVLRMIDKKLVRQQLINDGNVCDAIDTVEPDGARATVYFDVGALLEAAELARRTSARP